MHCFRCQAENVDGSRFCGNCGASFGTIPPADGDDPALHVTDPTRQMPAGIAASSGLPRLSRGGRPIVREDAGMTGESLGSLRVPVSTGARVIKVVLIVLLDLAMAGVGLALLLTSDCLGGGSSGGATQEEAAAKPVTGGDGGVVIVVETGADARAGGGGGAGSNVVGSGSGGQGSAGGGGTGTGSGTGTGTGTGTGSGSGTATVRVDAGIDVHGPDATPAASSPDAGGTSAPADAAVVAPPVDASTEGTFTADDIGDQVNVALANSQSRLSRCYTQATKALPDDQPLSGEVDIAFEVMPTGATQGVAVARNTTGSNTLASCLAAVVGDWEFSRFVGESLDFQRTFRFKPASQ